jgi:hypothetical protein
MARTIVEIDKAWPDKLDPQKAWIISIERTGGQGGGFNVGYGFLRSVAGKDIDIRAELVKGAGTQKPRFCPGKSDKQCGEGKGSKTPTSLSLVCSEDITIGLVLDKSMRAEFDPAGPFSGGYLGADQDYFEATFVSPTTAYLKAQGGRFGADFVKEFNIHLLVRDKFPDGEENVTPIILDPEMRNPPPGFRDD